MNKNICSKIVNYGDVSEVGWCFWILAFHKARMMLTDENIKDVKELVRVIFLYLDSQVKGPVCCLHHFFTG